MRLSYIPRPVSAEVSVVEDSTARPLRINFSGLVIRLNVDEAIKLANQLVDTAETVKTLERNQQ